MLRNRRDRRRRSPTAAPRWPHWAPSAARRAVAVLKRLHAAEPEVRREAACAAASRSTAD
ncbi:MAG: hypothetical protein U0736_28160 [Gemmataceae bacterium]